MTKFLLKLVHVRKKTISDLTKKRNELKEAKMYLDFSLSHSLSHGC